MKELITLLKVILYGDINIFKIKSKNNRKSNLALIIFLTLSLVGVSFSYSMMFLETLKPSNMTHVMLTLFMAMVSVLVLLETVYKSQGILFDSKDNDLLFSMPISKKTIVMARLIKLLIFQYIFDFILMIPAIIVYAMNNRVGIDYWITSTITIILIPFLPTIIGSFIGYLIKILSTFFKKRNIVQTISTLISSLAIFYLAFNLQSLLQELANNAEKINELLSKVYYPIKLFISLILKFNIVDLSTLIIINVIAIIMSVKLFSLYYFKMISKNSEFAKNGEYKINNGTIKSNSQLKALLIKEYKRFFSSSIYLINVTFGLILIFIVAILVSVNFEGTLQMITKNMANSENSIPIVINIEKATKMIPTIFMCIILFTIPMSVASSSSISVEGGSINITKSLPVDIKKIFLSKILMSISIIVIPLILTTSILSIRFNFEIIQIIQIIIGIILLSSLFSILGLFVNLKNPKMDAENDTVIVKQSLSVCIMIFGGFSINILIIALWFITSKFITFNLYFVILTILLLVLSVIIWKKLNKYGKKEFINL